MIRSFTKTVGLGAVKTVGLGAVAALVAALVVVVGGKPAAALDDLNNYVFVPNRASADVGVIDTRTDKVVARIAVGHVPHQVVVSDTLNKLVASNMEDDTVSIVDLDTMKTVAVLKLGNTPEHMQLSPMGDIVAVGNIGSGEVSLVSLKDDKEVRRIKGFYQPHNLTWSPDGSILYVANLGANLVTAVDADQGTIIKEIPVGSPQTLASKGESDDEFQGIINVTQTPDGRLGFAAYGEGGDMAVIDLRTLKTLKTLNVGSMPWRAYTTADGRYMLVPNNGDRTVTVVDTAKQEVVKVLPGGDDMTGINTGWFETTAFVISRGEDKVIVLDLVEMNKAGEIPLASSPETGVTSPDGTKLYVSLSGSDRVAVIDTRKRRVVAMIDGVGKEPWGAFMVGSINYCH